MEKIINLCSSLKLNEEKFKIYNENFNVLYKFAIEFLLI